MAVVFMEGFDHLSGGQTVVGVKGWNQSGAAAKVTGRLGGQALSSVGTQTCWKALPGSYSTFILGAAIYWGTANQTYIRLYNGSAATVVVGLLTVVSGATNVFRLVNSAGTVLATGTTPITTNTWYYVEIKVVVSATVGSVELRLNGLSTAECSASGVDTGALNVQSVGFPWGNGQTMYMDDIYAVDTSGSAPTNDFLGDVRVETLAPNGNGANTAWTGVYTDIYDSTSHDTDTTYISSATPGDRETATLADLSVGTGTVYAVQTNLVARKDDAGARTIAPVIRIGGVNYDGTTTGGLSTSYVDYTQLYDRLAPSGAAWSIATVNAMEAGVKEVA